MAMLTAFLADAGATFWLPEQASTVAPATDWLFNFVMAVNIFFVAFVIKYRHRPGSPQKHESYAGHSTALELTWTMIPLIIVLVIYYYGFKGFIHEAVEPPNCYEITATGRMWNWSFQYPNGYSSPELHFPANTPVRVILTSNDVIHSLFIPAFRVKKDVVPGRYNRLWFNAHPVEGHQDFDAEGHQQFDVFCAGYCGIGHSQMITKAILHDPNEFPGWLAKASIWIGRISPMARGQEIYKNAGCATCHSLDGARIIGPSWKDVFGSQVTCEGGVTVTADENYIRESILEPSAKIVAGYPNVMPTYKGQLPEHDIQAVTAYLKYLSSHYTGDKAALNAVAPKPPASQPGSGIGAMEKNGPS